MSKERYLDYFDALEISAPEISFAPIERAHLAGVEYVLREQVIRAAKGKSQHDIGESLNAYHTLVLIGFVKWSAYDQICDDAYALGGFPRLNEQEA